jgi:Ca-activated chloride channel family protein
MPRRVIRWLAAVSACCVAQQAVVGSPVLAQETTQVAPEPDGDSRRGGDRRRPSGPYEAYEAGIYDQALQGFVDLQVERPDDLEVALNVGSAQYQMRDYAEADRTFSRAATAQDPSLREQALYNLGNSAYRQGRLQEAVELYKAALEIDPDDEDAKFNLEYVRDEIRRRHEEAQKRQQEQQQGQQQQEQQQDEQQQDRDSAQQEAQPDQGEGRPDEKGEQQEQPSAAGEDQDRDGLPDQIEQNGDNPTDPSDPDSDDDGLPDGAEDVNRNGRVDPGETDPNQLDSDGDGVPDGQQAQVADGRSEEPESLEGLTPEEAERYLQALQEGRPERQHGGRGRRVKGDKDW